MNQEAKKASLNAALIDYFRCPEGLIDLALRGDLCPGEGFFRFGPDVVCYGQSSLGYYAETPAKATCDLGYHVRMEGTTCYIPFDPTAVVENLRRERYLGRNPNHDWTEEQISLVRKTYHRLRPHLGVLIRRRLRRLWLRGAEKERFPSWPVDRTVDQLLEKLLALVMKAHQLERIPFIWFWPDGQKSCAILAHQVEESSYDISIPNVRHLDSQFGGCCTVMPFFIGNVLEFPVRRRIIHSSLSLLTIGSTFGNARANLSPKTMVSSVSSPTPTLSWKNGHAIPMRDCWRISHDCAVRETFGWLCPKRSTAGGESEPA